jgi:hypothetical protein
MVVDGVLCRTMKNNFTTNPDMEDIQIDVFCDSSLARMEWEENFERLDKSDHWFFYTDCGEKEKPSYPIDLIDFSACTEKDYRAMCIDNFEKTFREHVEDMKYNGGTWEDYFLELVRAEEYSFKYFVEKFEPCSSAKVLYNYVSIHGCSQGDYANVIYFTKEDEGEECYLHPKNKSSAASVFTNYFYDQQVEFLLTIDGEGYHFDEAKDCYSWDKDEAIAWVKTLDISEKGKEWIIENLPDCPDYN